ncbi:protein serine/threonine phosphatase 2C family protein [Vibrio cholerae]|nr:protein serine/threonine phosphatase 2C family protein [Vibrio cholerae]ELD3371379.1 protein serine/threonine phosphatase 2C family protein [Vibrio cholerae]ELE5868206.1 protein serine/threonine phosphatase 2C family protein [Vibrio cholerae]ELG7084187.1 protein serine/threonine phosphatase 2C family protein [Vibrio cholerae]
MIHVLEASNFSYPKPMKHENEDFLLLPTYDNQHNLVFAIADGVGSTAGASSASRCAIESVANLIKKDAFSVELALIQAKRDVDALSLTDKNFARSATTLTVVQITREDIVIGHTGDCRVYAKLGRKLKQLTKDHTRYQEMIDEGEHPIKKINERKERLSSVITKAISPQIKLDYDITVTSVDEYLENGVLLLSLMSDGAYDYWQSRPKFSDSTMSTPSAFINSLRKRIETKGPKDDYSCMNVKIYIK